MPFGGMFGDIAKLLGQQGPDAWVQTASQLALSVAQGDDHDPNPDPLIRQQFEEIAPLVARHVGAIVGVDIDHRLEATNRTGLTRAALEQWRPLLEPLATSTPSPLPEDPSAGMFGALAATLGPLMAGFQIGSVAGHYSERAWGLDLALPRRDERHLIVINNVNAFATEWSLELGLVAAYAVAREMVAALVLSRPGTGDALRALVADGVKETMALQGDIVDRLRTMVEGGVDPSELMSDPARLLDGVTPAGETPANRAINAATAALTAYFDAVALDVTSAMYGPNTALAEARARYRRSEARGEDAAAALFGIANLGPHQSQAVDFVEALRRDHGLEAFSAFLRVDGLVSSSELAAPEAWWHRVSTSPLA
jgi:uncharacterized protein (DUF2342 family)